MRIIGGFTPLLRCYWFTVKSELPIEKVLITPVPEGIYLAVGREVEFVKTLVPVVSTQDAVVTLENDGKEVYIRVSCLIESDHYEESFRVPLFIEKINRIKC